MAKNWMMSFIFLFFWIFANTGACLPAPPSLRCLPCVEGTTDPCGDPTFVCIQRHCVKPDESDNIAKVCQLTETSNENKSEPKQEKHPDASKERATEIPTCKNGQKRPCQTKKPNPCQTGKQVCNQGDWSACEPVGTKEVCDDLDNDCDGQIDEEDVCKACDEQSSPGTCCTKKATLDNNENGNSLISMSISGQYIAIGGDKKTISVWEGEIGETGLTWIKPKYATNVDETPTGILATFNDEFIVSFEGGRISAYDTFLVSQKFSDLTLS